MTQPIDKVLAGTAAKCIEKTALLKGATIEVKAAIEAWEHRTPGTIGKIEELRAAAAVLFKAANEWT